MFSLGMVGLPELSTLMSTLVHDARRRSVGLGLALGACLLSIEGGRIAAGGSTRMVSLLVMAVAAPLVAQLSPMGLLVLALVASPLPLFMQAIRASLFVPLLAGILLARIAAGWHDEGQHRSSRHGQYLIAALPLMLVTTVSAMRESNGQGSSDAAAALRIGVGLAFFFLCLSIIRTPKDLRRAYVGLALAGLLVAAITMMQLAHIPVPGVIGGVGTLQLGESGLASNLRISGPIGDYELLAEFYALVGTVAFFFASRARGERRLLWMIPVVMSVLGIAVTSTRSGLIVLALGFAAVILAGKTVRTGSAWLLLTAGGAVVLLMPFIQLLQTRLGTGFIFQRLATVHSGGGLGRILDRGKVWSGFWRQLPNGWDLLIGRGTSLDLHYYGSYPHSLPLTLLFTVGIAGLAAFALFVSLIGWHCWRTYCVTRSPYAFLGLLLVVLFVINELKIEFIRVYNYEWFVFGVLGVAAASASILAEDDV